MNTGYRFQQQGKSKYLLPLNFKANHFMPDVPDETVTKSYGAVPLEFDKPEETVEYLRDVVMRRGVI